MEKRKVFISGSITGDPDYREKFRRAEEELTAAGFLVMNPAVFQEGFSWSEYMHVTLAMLDVCDTIYMLNGWSGSKGASVEFRHAVDHAYDILYESDKLPQKNTK